MSHHITIKIILLHYRTAHMIDDRAKTIILDSLDFKLIYLLTVDIAFWSHHITVLIISSHL